MKKIFFISIIFILVSIFGCDYEDNSTPVKQYLKDESDNFPVNFRHREGERPVILFMGDSRADFGNTWDDLPYEVYNVARYGSSTYSILKRLFYVDQIHPDYVVIFTGINDYTTMSPEQFQKNLNIIFSYLSQRTKIILMDISINPNFPASFAVYSDNKKIMENYSCYLSLNLINEDFTDSVHFSELGYKKVSEAIMNFIER
jgi:lysophospholipase L1-like esterase